MRYIFIITFFLLTLCFQNCGKPIKGLHPAERSSISNSDNPEENHESSNNGLSNNDSSLLDADEIEGETVDTGEIPKTPEEKFVILDGCLDDPTLDPIPNVNTYNGLILNGTGDSEVFEGSAKGDYFTGGKGSDLLVGGPGNDFLFGEGQNDTLIGGPGINILRGGAAHDKFKFITNEGISIIEDFTGRFGEHIDLKELLVGYTGDSDIDDFVRFSLKDTLIVLEVDKDGPQNGSQFKIIAYLITGSIKRETNYAGCSQKRIGSMKLVPQDMIKDGSLLVN